MPTEFLYDVFISYSQKDLHAVRALAERLKNDGLRVWFDEWIIPAQSASMTRKVLAKLRRKFEDKPLNSMDIIRLRTEEGLRHARTLLLVLSPNAVAEWGTLERRTILFRDPANPDRRFIPLLLADCQLPAMIAQFACFDWRQPSDETYTKLLAACRPMEESVAKVPAGEKQVDQAVMVLKGHSSGVWDVAVTPDGQKVVSGGSDKTIKVWDLATGQCLATFEGHTDIVYGVTVTPDGKYIVSGSKDNTLKLWDLALGECLRTFAGHTKETYKAVVTPDGKRLVTGSQDETLKIWDIASGQCLRTLFGHTDQIGVHAIAVTPDGNKMVSGSHDYTMKVWDLSVGRCLATLRGHTGMIQGIVVTPDGEQVISGSWDKTLKVWDLVSGRCLATFEGHTAFVNSVTVTPDGKRVVSGSQDKTLKVWDLATGQCLATFTGHTDNVFGVAITPDGKRVVSSSEDETIRVWELPEFKEKVEPALAPRYTNAKVVLVGESGVGKTGLALRIADDRWEATESTHGMRVWQLNLPQVATAGIEREVWLWDFAGQPDYRLIHQLYMDETALALLVIDPQKDNPFEPLGHWEKALASAVKRDPAKLLIAGRCDRGGLTVSREKLAHYCQSHGYREFLNTAAKTGDGCDALKTLIAESIPWERLPWTATSALFKTLKDAIIRLKDEGIVLVRISELRQRLQMEFSYTPLNPPVNGGKHEDVTVNGGKHEDVTEVSFPPLAGGTQGGQKIPHLSTTSSSHEGKPNLDNPGNFDEKDLRAVVGLLAGQGIVQKLDFGDFVLLQPEQINNYASAVVRSVRNNTDEIGCISERDVLEAALDFKEMPRLAETDEKILLRAMLQTFMDRALCVREETPVGTHLVFPSYFKQDRPEIVEHPHIFVTYGFAGPLDEIYATLVARLHYTNDFEKAQLWRYAADFTSLSGKRVGLQMTKKADDRADILVYFEADVPVDTQAAFIKYIHEHLQKRAKDVTRVRSYVCPHCDTPLENRAAIQKRLELGKTDILCGMCEERVPLLDLIEEKFASNELARRVQQMDAEAQINLDNESRELILVGHAAATAAEAGQFFQPIADVKHGIDGKIECKDETGKPGGQFIYLQLRAQHAYRYTQQEGRDLFVINNLQDAQSWHASKSAVMLVHRTADGQILWMNVTAYLRQQPKAKQIVFDGEPFTALNLARLQDELSGRDTLLSRDYRRNQERKRLQQQWDLLTEKLSDLEQEKIVETQPDGKFRLKKKIAEIEAERQTVATQLDELEADLQ
jgi:WD40 repeat protein